MVLVNRTRIPDAVLRAILKKAARAVKARISGTRACVSHGHGGGHAIGGTSQWPGGQVWVTVLRLSPLGSTTIKHRAQVWAERFYRTARHEWAHVGEHQVHGYTLPYACGSPGSRRPRWRSRPEEIRAEDVCYDADERGRGVEWARGEIATLASALETESKEEEAQ